MADFTVRSQRDDGHFAAVIVRGGRDIAAVEVHDGSDEVELIVWDAEGNATQTSLVCSQLTEED